MNVDELLSGARDVMTVKRVYGEPIERDGMLVIPAANVVGGGGGGGDGENAAGGGFGVSATPAGAWIIRNGEVAWEPVSDLAWDDDGTADEAMAQDLAWISTLGAVVLLLVGGCANKERQLEQVAKDWCLTIRASQVIPVYPMTEDLQPGDVFLVQRTVDEQVGDLEEVRLLGELLDGVPAVLQDALVAVDVGDRAAAGGGVDEAGVVDRQAGGVLAGADLADVGGLDGAVQDRDVVLLTGPVVADGEALAGGAGAGSSGRALGHVGSSLVLPGPPLCPG